MTPYIFSLFITLFLLSACVQQNTQDHLDVEEPKETPLQESTFTKEQQVQDLIAKKKSEEKVFSLPPAPSVPDDEPITEIPSDLKKEEESSQNTPSLLNIDEKSRPVLEAADLKTKSFSYIYREPPYNSGSDRFIVRGNKIRIMLGENSINLVQGISDVFLDTRTKAAIGYCIPHDSFLCEETQNTKFAVSYNDFYRKTSYDWMKDIVEAQYIGSEQMENRAVAVLQARLRDQPAEWEVVRFYIEKFYGLPMRIDIEQGNGKTISYNFDNIDTNSYEETDVTPPGGY